MVDEAFGVGRTIIRNHYEEGLVHDVGFLRKDVNEIDVVVHEDAKEHIFVVATDVGEALYVRSDIDTLGANKNLNGKIKRVEEILIAVFDAFAFGFGHEIKVDRLTRNNGAEGSVLHDYKIVAKLGNKDGGLGGDRIFGNFGYRGRRGRLSGGGLRCCVGVGGLGWSGWSSWSSVLRLLIWLGSRLD